MSTAYVPDRAFAYEVVLGRHRGMKIAGPRVLIGPNRQQLRLVYGALEDIDRVARDNGLEVEAVVLRKRGGA